MSAPCPPGHRPTTDADGFVEDGCVPIAENCRVCGTPIASCELCEACAAGNDPFVQSKYGVSRV